MDPEEIAHDEPTHLDLCCLKIQQFSLLALKVLVNCVKTSGKQLLIVQILNS